MMAFSLGFRTVWGSRHQAHCRLKNVRNTYSPGEKFVFCLFSDGKGHEKCNLEEMGGGRGSRPESLLAYGADLTIPA